MNFTSDEFCITQINSLIRNILECVLTEQHIPSAMRSASVTNIYKELENAIDAVKELERVLSKV